MSGPFEHKHFFEHKYPVLDLNSILLKMKYRLLIKNTTEITIKNTT